MNPRQGSITPISKGLECGAIDTRRGVHGVGAVVSVPTFPPSEAPSILLAATVHQLDQLVLINNLLVLDDDELVQRQEDNLEVARRPRRLLAKEQLAERLAIFFYPR